MFRLNLIITATLFCNISFANAGIIPGIGEEKPRGPGVEKPWAPDDSLNAQGECKMMFLPSGLMLNYCTASFPNEAIPRNIVYFFHGLNGQPADMFNLLNKNSPFYPVVNRLHDEAPFFISLSFGTRETIPIEAAGLDPASLRDLLDFALPLIEKDFLFYDIPVSRHLIGMSLGGHNALSVAALRPQYFKSVMAICPALINFNPFDPAQVQDYINRGQYVINPTLVNDMISTLKTKYVTEANWIARSPIHLLDAGKYDGANLFISTGSRDEYGFFEGAEAFSKAANMRHSRPLVFAPATGGHCSANIYEFGAFLQRNLK